MSKLKVLWGVAKVLGPGVLTTLSHGGRLPVVDGRRIDAKAQAASDLTEMLRDPLNIPTVDESRAQLDKMAAKFDRPCPADVTKLDITLEGAFGPRAARIYVPAGRDPKAAQPTLFYLHGGGWVQGSIASHDGLCGHIAKGSGVRVISYDYVLAPEHKFPDLPDDVLAAYTSLLASDLGVSWEKLIVGGDSAGANLTAVLMHDLAVTGGDQPRGQLLIYPAVDGRRQSRSIKALADQPLLHKNRIDWFFDQYLPEGTDVTNPRFSALLSDKLAGQPPVFMVSGGHDPLLDDAAAYAQALTEAGVEVAHLSYEGQVHAFMSLTKVIPEGRSATDAVNHWIREFLNI